MSLSIEARCKGIGGTKVRIDFGPNAWIEFDLEAWEGWEVIDNRRRYPHSAGASLSILDAARFAKQMGSEQSGTEKP